MAYFEEDVTGLDSHAARVLKRGSDPWICVPRDSVALGQWRHFVPFVKWDAEVEGMLRLKANQLTTHGSHTRH